jgi:uncharacterized protein (DUF2141 family)
MKASIVTRSHRLSSAIIGSWAMAAWALLAVLACVCGTVADELAPAAPTALPPTAALRVACQGLRNAQGHLAVLLFDRDKGFPQDPRYALRQAIIPLKDDHGAETSDKDRLAVFVGLPEGEYAVGVLHDENGDGTMNTTLVGIPNEGVGSSNNPVMRLGPPRFRDAKFHFTGETMAITVVLRYF